MPSFVGQHEPHPRFERFEQPEMKRARRKGEPREEQKAPKSWLSAHRKRAGLESHPETTFSVID